jgi:hypothetical protein
MKILNLSKLLKFKNNELIKYNTFTFPSGEEHIKINSEQLNKNDKIVIAADFISPHQSANIMKTLLATNVLHNIGIKNIVCYL